MSDQVTNVVADVHTALEYAVHDLTHQYGDGSTIENKNSSQRKKCSYMNSYTVMSVYESHIRENVHI